MFLFKENRRMLSTNIKVISKNLRWLKEVAAMKYIIFKNGSILKIV